MIDEAIEWQTAPVLGPRTQGATYIPRPGSYAVIFDEHQRIAVIRTAQGLFLPGGGADPGESLEQTLHREIAEECGPTIQIRRRLGHAIQLVFAPAEGHFEKRCVFFEAAF